MLRPVFAFRYLKLHDDIDVDALVTELKPLKYISSSFVPDNVETVCDVSTALTSALKGIYRSTARLYLTESMSMLQQSDHFRACDG